jgi:hypothetical protein
MYTTNKIQANEHGKATFSTKMLQNKFIFECFYVTSNNLRIFYT